MKFEYYANNFFFHKLSYSIKITKKEVISMLYKEVFNDDKFKNHIKETALKTKFPEEVVEAVLKDYIIKVSLIINIVNPKKQRILIYGFFSIEIEDSLIKENSKYNEEYFKNKFPFSYKIISRRLRRLKKRIIKH